MERQVTTKFRVGEWCVEPDQGTMTRNGATTRLEVRSMRLLMCLAERRGQVVNVEELISRVWGGVSVSPDSVYQAITGLRRQLGDDPRKPAYIETVPRLGYRLIAETAQWVDVEPKNEINQPHQESAISEFESGAGHSGSRKIIWAIATLAILAVLGFVLHAKLSNGKRASASFVRPGAAVGVVPFLDLTEGMRDEEFADGITEEIIDKLSKVPGVQVPSATSSFYYKGKELPVGDIARGLKVNYLLDGTVRKSNGRVRIAARLLRADNSYVIWTNTYDRPMSDLIMVQDDIAGEVVKALGSALGPAQAHDKTD
jgi:transcriptional activator of cad operon